jgi:hypothetical protein
MIRSLTPEQASALAVYRDSAIADATSTEPTDHEAAERAICALHDACGITRPQFAWTSSPLAASIFFGAVAHRAPWHSLPEARLPGGMGSQVTKRADRSISTKVTSRVYTELVEPLRVVQDAVVVQPTCLAMHSAPHNLSESGCAIHKTALKRHTAREYITYCSYMRNVLGVKTDPETDALIELWADVIRKCYGWWSAGGLVVASERPTVLRVEGGVGAGTLRLHSADGPALAHRSSVQAYYWHGTPVPAELIDGPPWGASRILQEPNVEIRRCAIERAGWDAFIRDSGMRLIGTPVADPGNPGFNPAAALKWMGGEGDSFPEGTLALYDVPSEVYGAAVRVLLCSNGTLERDGTRRCFGLVVPTTVNTPLEAAAWTYGAHDHPVGVSAEAYNSVARRR